MNKFMSPKRYMPDYHMSISHEHSYMREVKGQGYIDGELYDELYQKYVSVLTAYSTFYYDHMNNKVKKNFKAKAIRFLERHVWKLIIIYCIGVLTLLVRFIGGVVL